MKVYSESRIELRHLKILKKMLELSEQPCEPKNLDVILNIVGVEKYSSARKTCVCGQQWMLLNASFKLKGTLVTASGNLCPLQLVILKSV